MSGGCMVSDLEELGLEDDVQSDNGHLSGQPRQSPSHGLGRANGIGASSSNGHCSNSSPVTASCSGTGCRSGSCAGTGKQNDNVEATTRVEAHGLSSMPSASCSSVCQEDRGGASLSGEPAGGATIAMLDGGGGVSGAVVREGAQAVPLCAKCRTQSAELIANQREPYCAACLRASLAFKFKTAVNKHALVQAHDAVLLAFSGGHASTALLHFLSEMQSYATTPQAAVADRGKTVFRLGLAFVSEAAVLPRPNHSGDADIERIRTLAAPFEERGCRVHIVRLEELFLRGQSQPGGTGGERILPHTGHDSMADGAPGRTHDKSAGQSEAGWPHGGKFEESPATRAERLAAARERLRAVVGRVADATAQEDLVEMLRGEALQQVAREHGYTKIATGVCASRLAARVLTGTIKGRGFSLPADLQPVDRRPPVPLVAPLRDCVIKELAMLCTLSRWPTAFVPSLDAGPAPRQSLNRLTHDFLNLIEDDLPGRTMTILRTAGKLQPFPFNAFPALPPGHRARLQPAQGVETAAAAGDGVALCALCRAPLSNAELREQAGWRRATGDDTLGSEQRAGAGITDGQTVKSDRRGQGQPEVKERSAEAEGAAEDLSPEGGEEARSKSGGSANGGPAEITLLGSEAPGREHPANGTGRRSSQPGTSAEESACVRGGACCRSCREQVLGGAEGAPITEWLDDLPWVSKEGAASAQAARRAHLRNEIEDFLL